MTSKRNIRALAIFCLPIILFVVMGFGRAADSQEALKQKDREKIEKQLGDLTGRVKMVMFTQELECQYCVQTRQLLEALAAMSEKLTLTVFDFVHDKEEVRRYGVDKIPATVLMAEEDVGIRYYGVPAGYELSALVETIKDLSSGTAGLNENLIDKLAELTADVHIQVFVTPTCPYCPGAVRAAYRLAQEHPRVRADGVEVVEFPFLGNKYHVRGVPMVVINETTSFVGAQSEAYFVEKMLEAVRKGESQGGGGE